MESVLLRIKPGRPSEDQGPLGVEHVLSAAHSLLDAGVSLRIANVAEDLRFLVRANSRQASVIESLLYGQYPDAVCEPVADDGAGANTSTLYLTLRRPSVFPIKRYPQLVDPSTRGLSDPLAILLATIAGHGAAGMSASVSIDLAPAPNWFRPRATDAVLDIAAREFQRKESWTDRFVRLRLLPKPARFFLHPFLAFTKSRLPLPSEAPVRSLATESVTSHDKESDAQACLAKLRRPLFRCVIRLSVAGPAASEEREAALVSLAACFAQFDLPGLNGFVASSRPEACILSTEEIATLWHLPGPVTQGLGLDQPGAAILPPPRGLKSTGRDSVVLGTTLYRRDGRPVTLAREQRRRHLWIVGKTGVGKSTLLENLLLADIEQGQGVGLIDPHGDLAMSLLRKIPSRRTNDVLLIDPANDPDHPIGFNPLDVAPARAAFAVDGLVATFFKVFGAGEHGSWGPRLEDILRSTLLALIEAGGMTLLDVLRMFDEEGDFRDRVARRVRNPVVRHWLAEEFPRLRANRREDPFASVTNKLRQLLATPAIRDMLTQPRNRLDLRAAMDDHRIVIGNLAKGRLGERTSMFLGSLLVTRFQLDAMSRAERPEASRADFFLTIDEFQNFATPSFADILSEARKYRLGLTLANQYSAQMPESLAAAILGNVGTIVSFAVGQEDAALLAEQMGPPLQPEDLVSLPRFHCYARTEMDGMVAPPFSLATLPPPRRALDPAREEAIRRASRGRYGAPRAVVEALVRQNLVASAKNEDRARRRTQKVRRP